MKLKLFIGIFAAIALNACNPKRAAIQNELKVIEKTAQDSTQSQSVRESAEILKTVVLEKQGVDKLKMRMAQWELLYSRNETTIATYVAFLKAIEKKFPEELPEVEIYEAMRSKAGTAKIVEYNVGQITNMMSNSIENITLFGDPTADGEVDGVLRRLTEKHGTSETGKILLEFLNMVHEQGLQDRAKGIKPWESPSRSGAGETNEPVD